MLLASHAHFDRPANGPKHFMATLTMASLSGDAHNAASRGHKKRTSGAAPPPFSFPATPLSISSGPGPTQASSRSSEGDHAYAHDQPSTPPLQTPNILQQHTVTEDATSRLPFDPDFAPPDVAIILSTPPNGVQRSSPAALPVFSFGAPSDAAQRPTTGEQPSPHRKHRHKRSTAQSIDVSGLDLRSSSATAARTDGTTTPTSPSTDAARTPATTPHRLTFGPSALMESHPSPPSSRGSGVRFSEPAPLPVVKHDRLSDHDDESALIDLDLAIPDDPPSPRARKGRRAGSMHSGGSRIIINQHVEGHRRTESAPQLAPAFLLDPNFTRRQSMTPSSLFPLGDVFEEDEEQEPRHDAPDMSDSALPSPQTTLATPRLDTANSSALSFGATSTATTSDGDLSKRSASRRKRFGRKLMFWKRFSQSEPSLVCDVRGT